MTALHLAASHDEVEVCRMLIEKGSNLRCCDEEMGTPLHFACMEGSEKVVRMLFEAGEKLDGWVTISQVGLLIILHNDDKSTDCTCTFVT